MEKTAKAGGSKAGGSKAGGHGTKGQNSNQSGRSGEPRGPGGPPGSRVGTTPGENLRVQKPPVTKPKSSRRTSMPPASPRAPNSTRDQPAKTDGKMLLEKGIFKAVRTIVAIILEGRIGGAAAAAVAGGPVGAFVGVMLSPSQISPDPSTVDPEREIRTRNSAVGGR